jgi:spermidine synthase/predicted MFS family arabinose efflux permease
VALTRVFSVMLTYHFVFAIVSAAMFGLGVGGFLFKRWGAAAPERATWIGALVLSLSLAGSVVLILTLPVYGSPALAGVRFWLYLALATVPFGAAGYTVSGLFQRFPEGSSLLYGADLLGAAAGALAVVPAMDRFGPVDVVLLSAAVVAAGALLLGLPRRRRVLAAIGAVVVFGSLFSVLVASRANFRVPIANDPNKEMFGMLADPANAAHIVESRWSSFGRTDLVKSDLMPDQMWIFVDGAAGSAMYNLDPILKNPQEKMQLTQHFEESFPFPFLKADEKRSALTLGPGGGRDVVVAILGGVKDITAVEVNPDVVGIVRQYSNFDGGIYSGRPGVTAIVGEGRNYVRTTAKRFDLIMLSIPITKSSRSVEGYALTENNLFTVEAFEDYLNHLTANGRIIIVAHNDTEIYKLISIALGAFAKQAVSEREAMKHLYTIASTMMPAIVIQKQPLSLAEVNAIHGKLHSFGFDKGAFFIPWTAQQTRGPLRMLDQNLVDIANGSLSMAALAKTEPVDLRAPTDDRPFFYQLTRGLPSPFGTFGVLMALSVGAIAVLVALPRKRRPKPTTFIATLRDNPMLKLYLVLFFALGIGYMVIEIAFFQKLTLYISQPQMALTILLFSLLLGSGIGSLITSLLGRKRLRSGALASLGVALLIAALALVFSKVFALGVGPRVATMILVVPLGIVMGCPFPLALGGLHAHGLGRHTSVMWGVNGAASVFGSALAMIVGITWGFWSALFVGAAIYMAVAVLFVIVASLNQQTVFTPSSAATPTLVAGKSSARRQL